MDEELTAEEKEGVAQFFALLDGTRILCKVSLEKLLKPIDAIVMEANLEERAVLNVYHRMHACTESLSILRDPKHVQAINAMSRSLFEMLLEIKKLSKDPESAERYFAFPEIRQHALAMKFDSFIQEHGLHDDNLADKVKALLADKERTKRLGKNAQRLWGKEIEKISNWWGKDIAQRAKEMGVEYERRYRAVYCHECQMIHAGPEGGTKTPDEVLSACIYAHISAQSAFLEALDIVCRKFHLFDALPDLKGIIEDAGDYSKARIYALQEKLAKQNLAPD